MAIPVVVPVETRVEFHLLGPLQVVVHGVPVALRGAGERALLALLLLDVDKFKKINDTHGHPAGDKVLNALGALLGSAARSTDLAARYGGEEMALVLPGTSRATAAAIAESIRRAIAAVASDA